LVHLMLRRRLLGLISVFFGLTCMNFGALSEIV
jgi:hypothetical protein